MLCSIPKSEEPGNAYTADVRPVACIDNSGTKVVIFRGGGLKLSVFNIKDRKTFEKKDTIDVLKELSATGQPGFMVGPNDTVHEIRFLAGESENVRVHLQKGKGDHFFIDVQLSDGVPNLSPCTMY
jgi:hypothetical protein